MKVFAIDLETTGLPDENPDVVVTEIGYALWDTEMKRLIRSHSFLVNSLAEDEQVPEHITRLTGIDTKMVHTYGVSRYVLLDTVSNQLDWCDCVMARNAQFDQRMMAIEYGRDDQTMLPKPWICTKADIDYPDWVIGKTQSHIAADHGFLNPFPHQAIGDVLTMLRINELGGYSLEVAAQHAMSPMITLEAVVKKPWTDDGVSTGHAKKAGFTFDSPTKKWTREIRESRAQDMEWPFEVRRI